MNGVLGGPAFPFRIRAGRVQHASGYDKLEQDVRHLLAVRPGERVLRRGYGGGVHHHLQEPLDDNQAAIVAFEIEQALRVHLPGLRLTAPIRVTAGEEQLTVVVEYLVSPAEVLRRLEVTMP